MACMKSHLARTVIVVSLGSLGVACGGPALLPLSAGMGPSPTIQAPRKSLIPTIGVASARPWRAQESPAAAPGLAVKAFARDLEHPRWLYILPNGDVLVAETNAPPRPDDATGVKGWFFKRFQRKAGGAVPSADRILLLRDTNGDGVADVRSVLLSGLTSPFGIALVGSDLYVANTDAIVRFPYQPGALRIVDAGTRLIALPAGRLNHHWTKNLIASQDGNTLFVGVGSNSNAAENGMAVEQDRASIWAVDRRTAQRRILASGLRNPVGMSFEPVTGALWVAVNERDELGSDLVPDYMTRVRDGAFYGWPYSYFGTHVDQRVQPARADLVATAVVPDYALGAHTASLGLVFSRAGALPDVLQQGAFVGQHGSWNRRPMSGYKVIFIPFANGAPSGAAVDILTEFLVNDEYARGRPVGVALDARGALLVADDVGNAIWRVTAK